MNLRELLFLHAASGGGGSLVEKTVTGNPAAFTTQLAKPVKSITVPLTYTQSGSGDPSPSNIRPISGVSGLFCVHAKKNMGYLRGYSATNKQYVDTGSLSNNYGTTISSVDPVSSLVVTQTSSTTDYGKSNYRNGYFSIRTDNMVDRQHYDVSLKVTSITSNPLDASLSDWMIMPGQGTGSAPNEIKGDVLICKNILYREAAQYRQAWEVRNCGMSCTVSEFMVTPANTNDGVYEPYDGAKLDVTFPADVGTVYGGTLDLVSGVLTITDAFIAEYNGETIPSTWVSDRDVYSQGTEPTTGAQVVYKLSEPSVVQLDPHATTAINGTNTFWTDTAGDLTIKYLDNA